MTVYSTKRITTGILLLIFLIGPPYFSIVAHGDKKHDHNEAAKDSLSDGAMDTITDPVQDSLFLLINDKYQTVRHIFKYSCFDCHSDSTHYPWYYGIPGITGMIDDDIKDANKHLDLSNDFPFGGHGSQLENLQSIKEEIESGEMPLSSYRLTHWGRLIEGSRRDSVFTWIDESIALLKSNK